MGRINVLYILSCSHIRIITYRTFHFKYICSHHLNHWSVRVLYTSKVAMFHKRPYSLTCVGIDLYCWTNKTRQKASNQWTLWGGFKIQTLDDSWALAQRLEGLFLSFHTSVREINKNKQTKDTFGKLVLEGAYFLVLLWFNRLLWLLWDSIDVYNELLYRLD